METAAKEYGYISPDASVADRKEDILKVGKVNKTRNCHYISASEIGEDDEYDDVRYSWHRNTRTLTRDDGHIIEDIDELLDEVGIDFRSQFDDPQVMCVYIRDETLECDYIIEASDSYESLE
jgi:hypothetical protein